MNLLPLWNLTNKNPAFYDIDSLTAIEQTGKVYNAMNEMIKEFNDFISKVNKNILEFEETTNKDIETFTVSLRQEFQDFINAIDLKVKSQDNEIKNAVDYMKNNLGENITKLFEEYKNTDSFNDDVKNAFNDFNEKILNESKARETKDSELAYNQFTLEKEIEKTNARVNNITSMQEGSTTGDVELQDIRIGFDGTIYPTAGESVRSQRKELEYLKEKGLLQNTNKKVINLFDSEKITQGKIWIFATSTNAPYILENEDFYMTDFIEISAEDVIYIHQPNIVAGAYTMHITEYKSKSDNYTDMLNTTPTSITLTEKTYSYIRANSECKYIRIAFSRGAGIPTITKNIKLGNNGSSQFFDIPNESYFDDFEIAKINAVTLGQCDGINLFNLETSQNSGIYLENGIEILVTDFIECFGDDIFICNFLYKNISYAVNFYDTTSNEKIAQTPINNKRCFQVPSWCKRIRICFTESEKNIFEIYRIRQKKLLTHNSIDFFGDSIVQGFVGFINDEYVFAHPTWIDNISARTGIDCKNNGIGSTGYTVNSLPEENNTILDVAQGLNTRKNFACIWAGTNDFTNSTLPLGSIENERNSETIYGKIKETFYQIGLLYGGRVLVITPMKRTNHEYNNSYGYKLEDLCKAIKDVAKNVNYPVLDLFNDLPVGGMNLHLYTTDGLHPNQNCINTAITPVVLGFIKKYVI